MSFISNYLNYLRSSDEATKHRSALTIAIIASVIVLFFLFLIFKNSIFNNIFRGPEEVKVKTATDSIESPMTSFSKFIGDSGEQFSKLKSSFNDVLNVKNKKEESSTNLDTNLPSESRTASSSNNENDNIINN